MADSIFFFLIGISVGLFLGSYLSLDDMQKQAIDRGYGIYCPDTGAWAWKGECHE